MTLVTVPNPDAAPISHVSPTPIDVALEHPGTLDTINLGAINTMPVERPDLTKQSVGAEAIGRMVVDYSGTKTIQEQNNFIGNLTGMLKNLAKDQDVQAADYMSMMKDANGTKLFENREEAMRFISRIRGLNGFRGLSRRELYNLRRKKSRRAIFLNTVNKTLPPEEITKVDGRYYVDKHPLPYLY